jgi:hypothetical protein
LVVGPEDGERASHLEVKRLLHLGLSPLEGDPEMTPQRARPRAHVDRPEGIAHQPDGDAQLGVLTLFYLQGLPHQQKLRLHLSKLALQP